MRFDLDDDLQSMCESIRDFGRQEVAPRARAWDQAEALPAELLPRLGELGLLGLRVPEAQGGAGLSLLAAVTLIEELAAADASLALVVSTHNLLAVGHLLRRARPEVLEALLPRLVSGQALGAWALVEASAGSEITAVRTEARARGDRFVLQGDKSFVVGGMEAEHVVVFASAPPAGPDGTLTAFVIDVDPATVSARPVPTLGMRAAGTADLALAAVDVPAERQLGAAGEAKDDALALLDDSRIGMAAIAVGIGRAALEAATHYAKERKQFGRPIASFQAIQWKLADMAMALDAARLMVRRAAWLGDNGQPARTAAAQAKLFAAPRAVAVCSEALQIHGGYGYTEEFGIERYLRDARLCPMGEGTSEIQRIVVSRAIAARFGR
jgi:alkylation response protein AidB-like acyl-CoA dehydrogenase